jgi:hypothetical protein
MPPKRRLQIPEEYEDRPEEWVKAFDHAMNHSEHNSLKTCVLYAESHWQDFQDTNPTPESMVQQIQELQQKLDRMMKDAQAQ